MPEIICDRDKKNKYYPICCTGEGGQLCQYLLAYMGENLMSFIPSPWIACLKKFLGVP